MDEIRIHHFTFKSNQQSAERIVGGESCPKRPKTQGFGLHLEGCARYIDYLEKGRTINSEFYIALLVHLKEEITKKRPQMKKKSALSSSKCTLSQINHNNSKTT